MTQQTTYPTLFGGPSRACTIPVSVKARGRVAWSCTLDFTSPATRPDLLVLEGNVVAIGADEMLLFSPDGARCWKRGKRMGSPAAAANGLLYYETREHYLEAVTPRGDWALTKAPFPGVDRDEFMVTLLWPRQKDFLAASYLAEPTYDTEDPDAEAPEPELSVRLTDYGELIGKWGEDYEGVQQLVPLYVPEFERLILSLGEVVTIDLKLQEEISRFPVPLGELADWSADAEGTLGLTGYQEERKVLLALSPTGEEKWRWVDRDKPDRWVTSQPPIRFGNQRVYALTGGRVLALERGHLLWQREVKAGTLRHGSSLADGSILVTAGKTLLHLDAAGNELFSVLLEDEIETSPVVDADGHVYVATARRLFQIQ